MGFLRSFPTLNHDLGEHFELDGVVEADEVHAPLPAEVPPVEPVPVLPLVPVVPPREEVVVAAQLAVGLSWKIGTCLISDFDRRIGSSDFSGRMKSVGG